jgi:hypothetical protein
MHVKEQNSVGNRPTKERRSIRVIHSPGTETLTRLYGDNKGNEMCEQDTTLNWGKTKLT